MDTNWTVYMHITPNNKRYIGITSQIPSKRWRNGKGYKKCLFLNAIKKYGWNNIKHEILFDNLTKEEAEQKEIELIAFYKSNQREFGYNIENGGNCLGTHSKDTKEKISKALKGKCKSKLAVEHSKQGLLNFYRTYGTPKGRKISAETKEKLRKANKGHKITPEQKLKQCMALRGERNPMFNKHHTIQSKIKMSLNNKMKVKVRRLIDNKVYDSITDASKDNNISRTAIYNCLKGFTNKAANSKWEYVNERMDN